MKLFRLVAVLAVLCSCVSAQQATGLMPTVRSQFFDASGRPLSGGKLHFYAAGTNTPQAVYSDASGTTALANPVVLDSGGFSTIWLANKLYKVVVSDENDIEQYEVDNVSTVANILPSSGGGGPAGSQMPSITDYGAIGDCVTDDTAHIQAALNTHQSLYVPKPPGGCYLVRDTLIAYRGDYLHGTSSMDDALFPSTIIRMAPGRNRPLLVTAASQGSEVSNEYMGLQDITFDCNGPNQTAEIAPTTGCIDFRGAFILVKIDHVFIENSFGNAFLTGGDIDLGVMWIINTSTASGYGWYHNLGFTGNSAGGSITARKIYVEHTALPVGGKFAFTNDSNPTTYGHLIGMNRPIALVASEIHCESGTTCMDVASARNISIQNLTGVNIGNAASSQPSDRFLVRMSDAGTYALHIGTYYADHVAQGGSALGMYGGISSNDIPVTKPGEVIGGPIDYSCYFCSTSVAHPEIGEHPIARNRIDVQQTGAYSPNEVRISSPAQQNYQYWKKESGTFRLGFGACVDVGCYGSGAEADFLQMSNFGNPATDIGLNLLSGRQMVFTNGGHQVNLRQEATGVSWLNTNGLLHSPGAFFGSDYGSSFGTGMYMQPLAIGVVHGLIGSNMVYGSSPSVNDGLFHTGNDGSGNYSTMMFGTGGLACINSATVSPNSTLTTTQFLANTRGCFTNDGKFIMRPTLDSSGTITNDGQETIQAHGTMQATALRTDIGGNSDLAGRLAFSSSAAVSFTLTGGYNGNVAPSCTATPEFDWFGNSYWWTNNAVGQTYTFTLHFHSPVTGTVAYQCIGN